MKRCEVWQIDGEWQVGIDHHPERHAASRKPIWCRPYAVKITAYPTYADALAHALHEVGLTPANPEEQP